MKSTWKPMLRDTYYTISMDSEYTYQTQEVTWCGDDADYMRLRLGLVYKGYDECLRHLDADWEMLTGHRVLGEEE